MGIIKQKEVQAQEKDQINLYTIKQKDVQVQEKDQKRIRKSDATTPLRLEETRTHSEAHNERENEKECTEIQDSKTEKQQNGTYMKTIFSWLNGIFSESRRFIAELLSVYGIMYTLYLIMLFQLSADIFQWKISAENIER